MPVYFKKLDPKAILPSRNNVSDAGADLRSIDDVVIPPLSRALINTGLSLGVPSRFLWKNSSKIGPCCKTWY